MASDEQRSPWFAVKPEGQSSDDAAPPADAIEQGTSDPASPRATASTVQSFDDLLSPPRESPSPPSPSPSPSPYEPTPSRPSFLRRHGSQDAAAGGETSHEAIPDIVSEPAFETIFAAPTDAVETEPVPVDAASEPEEGPLSSAASTDPVASEPVASESVASEPVASDPVASEPVASAPIRSPYLSAERPRPHYEAHEAPATAPTAEESWGQDRRATPPVTEAIPQVVPAPAPAEAEPSEPTLTYAPWTGSIPRVDPPIATPEPAPESVAEPDVAEPDVAEPDVAEPDVVEPDVVDRLIPTPIEAEEAEILAPVPPPSAAEIQPQFTREDNAFAPPGAPDLAVTPEARPMPSEFTPEVIDPVKELGASALATASLEAAGAPTPRTGIPVVGGAHSPIPSFGDSEPFVPQFEPMGGVRPASVPTVSFTTPGSEPQPPSPLAHVAVPESDEPAYVPTVELDVTQLAKVSHQEPESSHTPSDEAPALTARPWAVVDPSDVEFVTGEPLGPETGAFGNEPRSESQPPARNPWEPAEERALSEPILPLPMPLASEPIPSAPADSPFAPPSRDTGSTEVESGATGVAPGATAAAFFAATAARSTRATDDTSRLAPTEPPSATAFEAPLPDTESGAPSPASADPTPPLHRDATRAEPFRTTATAYTPSQGEWGDSTVSASEAAALDEGNTSVNEPVGSTAPPSVADGDAAIEPTAKKPYRRRRLVLWIVIAALAAAAIGVGVYRVYLQPEPTTLPVPTITASAPEPTAEPVNITDPSTFVATMPSTVGTDVLVAYEVTNPAGDTTLPVRAAEHVTLKYGPGSTTTVYTVEAYQHYSVEDAQSAYDSYAAGLTDVEDVVVDGVTVGQRARSASSSQGTLVWRNETAVFVLTGPGAGLQDFYARFGV